MACNPVINHPKHLFACSTARAAEAAGVQGGAAGFWTYVESVYAQSQPASPGPTDGTGNGDAPSEGAPGSGDEDVVDAEFKEV